jgi:hypothetical protein
LQAFYPALSGRFIRRGVGKNSMILDTCSLLWFAGGERNQRSKEDTHQTNRMAEDSTDKTSPQDLVGLLASVFRGVNQANRKRRIPKAPPSNVLFFNFRLISGSVNRCKELEAHFEIRSFIIDYFFAPFYINQVDRSRSFVKIDT